MHTISSYRGNRPTHKHTDRQDWLQYTVLQLAHSVIIDFQNFPGAIFAQIIVLQHCKQYLITKNVAELTVPLDVLKLTPHWLFNTWSYAAHIIEQLSALSHTFSWSNSRIKNSRTKDSGSNTSRLPQLYQGLPALMPFPRTFMPGNFEI